MAAIPPPLDRELGQLAFQERVLALARDPDVPPLERLRYVCILSSNLDEFFEIRVAGLKQQILRDATGTTPAALAAAASYASVAERAHRLVRSEYACFNGEIVPLLAREGVMLLGPGPWSQPVERWARAYFRRDVLPVLTPIGLDPAHPFPRVLNKSLHFAVELAGEDAFGRAAGTAIVQAPRVLPRVIRVPARVAGARFAFVTLGAIIRRSIGELFPGMTVRSANEFRVTRNSELYVDDEEVTDLRVALRGELFERHFGDAVRLEVSARCPARVSAFLAREFDLEERDVYRVDGPVNLVRLNAIPDLVDRPSLAFPVFTPGLPRGVEKRLSRDGDLFGLIARRDVLLHHPYQSFQPVLDFVHLAATDPQVVAIKQTIYRTGIESALMDSLMAAARAGKEVTVVVELMARFDEEVNINWAARLEAAGAHVVHGVVGHKTHAKMSLVVRREGGRLVRYAHLGTGNYHARTARLYTDFGLFTCDRRIARDVDAIFKQLTAFGPAPRLERLWTAPFTLHDRIVAAIRREARFARSGKPARIVARMNALLEPRVIEALYAASQAGVEIDLVVRGVCALRPQVAGLSERIRVRSVLGRFLEHSRVFFFEAGGERLVYLSSADWMDRNFFRRIETCVPVLDPKLKARVLDEGLETYLRDVEGTWIMRADGAYERLARGKPGFGAQRDLIRRLGTPARATGRRS